MKIEPENRELWNRFQSCERNEMIITKSGRCLFPILKFKVLLEESDKVIPSPNSVFSYALGMERVDSYKWKYREGHWYPLPSPSSNSQHLVDSGWHLYEPETSPASWIQIQQEGLNFSKVKLTNRKGLSTISLSQGSSHSAPSSYFSLSSFGNYVPVVYFLDWDRFFQHQKETAIPTNIISIIKNFGIAELIRQGSLQIIKASECSFIAVTHYQNVLITHLKKHNNPHAKGFILTDESMGRMTSLIPRGKPGRKRRIPAPESHEESQGEYPDIPYDVLVASLALEKMSTGNVPRSEIIQTLPKVGSIVNQESEDKNRNRNFLGFYNKLK